MVRDVGNANRFVAVGTVRLDNRIEVEATLRRRLTHLPTRSSDLELHSPLSNLASNVWRAFLATSGSVCMIAPRGPR